MDFKFSVVACATFWIAIASPVDAQIATGAPTSSADLEPTGALAEIVVTAQKRTESAQRTPAAVTVIGSQDLINRGIEDLKAAEVLIPSTKLNFENSATQIFIRGVGSQLDFTWIPESVALSLDGIYLPRYSSSGAFYDIQRIEVLPGPQGTLYGRSAIGGAVNIITNRPDHEPMTDVLVEYGNYSTKHVTLVENAPISTSWSVRGAIDYVDNDGYNNNGTYSTDSIAARLSSLYTGTDFTAFVSGSYFYDRDRLSPVQYAPYPNGNAYAFPTYDTAAAFFYPPNGVSNSAGRQWDKISTLSGDFDWNVGPVTISYLPGVLKTQHEDNRVVVGFFQPVTLDIDQFSNELRISGSNDEFNWLGGLYQFYNKSYMDVDFGPNLAGETVPSHQKSYAVYGQGTYSITDRARITLGARVSDDQISAGDSEAIFPTGAPAAFAKGTIPFTYNDSWKKGGWKVGGEYDITSHSMLYANAQSGFNPGTFNTSAGIQGTPIYPQTMVGYTAGLKNQFWDGRARLNLEGYLYNYNGLVVQAIDFATGFTTYLNAPRTQIKGAQLDFVIAPIDNLKFNATFGYLDAEFKRFEAGSLSGTTAQNYAGYQLPYAPPETATIGGQYTIPLAASGSIGLRADTYISSSYWTIFNHIPDSNQKGFTKTDVSVTYYAATQKWDVGFYGKNLENAATYAAGATTGRPYPNAVAEYVEPPRLYGIRFHLKL